MVRALASYQCGSGSIPGLGILCGLSLLLVLVPAPRFSLQVLRFSSLNNNQHFQIPIRPGNSRWKSHPLESTKIPIFFPRPITRTLGNSNLPLTRRHFRLPSGHFLYNLTLDNSNHTCQDETGQNKQYYTPKH